MEITYGTYASPVGMMFIATAENKICRAVFFEKGKERAALHELEDAWPDATFKRSDSGASKIGTQIFSNKSTLQVLLKGTEFQKKVWKVLRTIPKGKTITYTDLAKKVGSPRASRAVGTACGKNTIAYLIPCHRVVASSGSLGGYRWGVARKKALLAAEAI